MRRLLATVGDLAAGHAACSGPRPLRELRAEGLLSIRDLARLAGVAPSTVDLIEAGRVTPHPDVMHRIAAALRVDAHRVAEFGRAADAPTGRAR